MAEVIHRYVGKDCKLPKPTPEEAKRQADQHKADAELNRERAEGLRVKRMQSQLLLAKARGELIPKALAQQQASFIFAGLCSRITAIPQTYSRRLLNISDFESMSKLLKEMSRSILREIEDLPDKVTDPNWIETLEKDVDDFNALRGA